MSETSKYKGLGENDVLETDIDNFFQNILLKQKEVILYLDAPWSLYSKRGWPVIKELYGNITSTTSSSSSSSNNTDDDDDDDNIPMYVYIYNGWTPTHRAFNEWWPGHVQNIDDFPKFAFTKYRAILLIVKEGQIQKIWINPVVFGEGGGFCIHKVIMDILGRPISTEEMNAVEANYYNRVCVDTLHHPLRTKTSNIIMSGTPCGSFHDGEVYPDTCNALLSEEL